MAKRFNPNTISDKQLIAALQALAKKLGRTPSQADMSKRGCGLTKRVHLYRQLFGSVKKAQEKAGLVSNKSGSDMKYSDKDLLQQIKDVKQLLGRAPSQAEIVKYGKYPIGAYKRRFETYNNAVKKAGFEPSYQDKSMITFSDIKEDIIRVSEMLGHSPTSKEFRVNSQTVSNVSVMNHYNLTWNEVLKKCGLEPNVQRDIPDVELKNEISRLKEELGYTPGYHDMSMYGKYSSETYASRFGTYLKALEHFGFDYTEHNQWRNSQYTRGKDGLLYRSKFEAGVGNILFSLKQSGEIQKYEYEKRVCEERQWTCDFYVKRDGKEYWLETDGAGRGREDDYIKNNEKIKYYMENDINYHILEYKKDIKKDLFGILLDGKECKIDKVVENHNLKGRKKKWIGGIDFPRTKNIDTGLGCDLDAIISWCGSDLTARYLKTLDEDQRDDIAKDLLNFFIEYDFSKLNYSKLVIDNDIANLKNNDFVLLNKTIVANLNYGLRACKTYFPHLLKTESGKTSIYDAVNNREKLFKIIRNRVGNTHLSGKEKRQTPFNITPAMILQGAKTSGIASRGSIFKPLLAKKIYSEWVKDGDVVYDYSAGFGGRLLGFFAAGKKAKYIGIDVEPKTYMGLIKMAKDFNIDAEIYNAASENFIIPCKINFAFSSPPYFKHEKYSSNPDQSANKYNTYLDWIDNYWRKTLENIKNNLFDDGVFAVNVGNLNNQKMKELHDDMLEVIRQQGFAQIDTWSIQTSAFNYRKNAGVRTETIDFFRLSRV